MGRVLAVLFGMAFAIAGVVFLAWVLWQLWKRQEEEVAPAEIEIKTKAPAVAVEPVVEDVEVEDKPAPDDLKLIEGIGPKIASVLQARGLYFMVQEPSG